MQNSCLVYKDARRWTPWGRADKSWGTEWPGLVPWQESSKTWMPLNSLQNGKSGRVQRLETRVQQDWHKRFRYHWKRGTTCGSEISSREHVRLRDWANLERNWYPSIRLDSLPRIHRSDFHSWAVCNLWTFGLFISEIRYGGQATDRWVYFKGCFYQVGA